MSKTIFELKDKRKIEIDFADLNSILLVEKSDWIEIKQQLDEWINIIQPKLTVKEFHEVYNKQ